MIPHPLNFLRTRESIPFGRRQLSETAIFLSLWWRLKLLCLRLFTFLTFLSGCTIVNYSGGNCQVSATNQDIIVINYSKYTCGRSNRCTWVQKTSNATVGRHGSSRSIPKSTASRTAQVPNLNAILIEYQTLIWDNAGSLSREPRLHASRNMSAAATLSHLRCGIQRKPPLFWYFMSIERTYVLN